MEKLNKNNSQRTSVEMFFKNISTKSKGFTLVELIIVITILAILATIAFISFQGYTKNARDSNRTATISNLQKGLDIYSVQVGNLPEPDGTILSGTLNNIELTRVGVIGDNISRLVKMNKTPTDPVGGNNYAYGISADNKYYQIGVTLENLESYNYITKTTYADNGSYRAKVVGNYKYPLKYNGKLYSLPSLIFTGTGGDLTQTGNAYFVINNGQNIPYHPTGILSNTQNTTQVLQSITGTGGLSLTGITLPSATSEQFKNENYDLGDLINLGITDKTILGQVIYGKDYLLDENVGASNGTIVNLSCEFNGTPVTHGNSVTAYLTGGTLPYGNTCLSQQRTCTNGTLSGTYTYSDCDIAGATGTFNLSSTNVQAGNPVTISNNCSIPPTSYASSDENVATIVGTTITTLTTGTTDITPQDGTCGDNNAKTLTVTAPNSCATTPSGVGVATTVAGTPTSSNQAWQSTNAGNPCYYTCKPNYSGTNCSTYTPPTCTSFTYSAWGACQPDNTQTRTITSSSPSGCTGGSPEPLLQSCTYVAPIPTYYNSSSTYIEGDKFIYTRGGDDYEFEVVLVTSNGYVAYTNVGNDAIETLSSTDHIGLFGRNTLAGTEIMMKTLNAGANTVWTNQIFGTVNTTNWNTTYRAWAGGLYVWGNNTDYSTTAGNPSGHNNNAHSTTWGTNGHSEEGICGTGYRLPTGASGQEWAKIYQIVTGQSVTSCSSSCGTQLTALQTYLKLPMAGYRHSSGTFYYQGDYGYYWSSVSSASTNAHTLYFNSSNIRPSDSDGRAGARSVRCIKN